MRMPKPWGMLASLDNYTRDPGTLKGWSHDPQRANAVAAIMRQDYVAVPDPVRIDWLPCDWPMHVAPIDLSPDAVNQFLDFVATGLSAVRAAVMDGDCLGVDCAEQAEAIGNLCRAIGTPNPLQRGATVGELLDAIETIKRVTPEPPSDQRSKDRDETETMQQYVTLSQAAPFAGVTKKTLENWRRSDQKFPPPTVTGGEGKANVWDWKGLRDYLQKRTGRNLPEQHPSGKVGW